MTDTITTIGLDLAKTDFQVQCADSADNPVLMKRLPAGPGPRGTGYVTPL